MSLFAGRQWRCRLRGQTCGHRWERRGRDTWREQHRDIHITICKIGRWWEFAVWLREFKPGLWKPRRVGCASLVAQLVKNLPAVRETWVQFLGWEDARENETATYSSILAWRIPWAVESMGLQRVGHDWAIFTHTEGQDGVGDWREVQKGGEICIPLADSCWRMTETNTIL